jgi:hypothetical protein
LHSQAHNSSAINDRSYGRVDSEEFEADRENDDEEEDDEEYNEDVYGSENQSSIGNTS